ncbi:hypothetical protein BCR43DRAFT_41129 [Syncephalastrum racemosum]|uniref:MYND-type domain-containing protein n=1 Tax=Syncephalastrum racemosum TaxID=13706 RepID=A0A1X2HUJ5_SYNRA|nr:hypothetical protein BCR43DRAFT_41129 [Syncephalastrum racemosum]
MTASLDNDDETTSPTLPQDNTNLCTQCQKPATFMCSSCALDGPRYCSLECQKLHWKTTHAKFCQATLATRRCRQQAAALAAVNVTDNNTDHNNINDNTQDDIAMEDLQDARHRQTQNDSSASDDQETEAEFAESLAHYVRQIYFVIQPVVICIILSIFWVKVSFSGSSDYRWAFWITRDATSTHKSTTWSFSFLAAQHGTRMWQYPRLAPATVEVVAVVETVDQRILD